VLATAHHRDDQIETVIFRILRGTGVAGLRGIPRVRRFAPDRPLLLWRPLLAVTRAELRDVLAEAGLAWREDPTNACGDATRNRIRLELRPMLERRFGTGIDAALMALIASADEVTAMVDAEAGALLSRCLAAPFAGRVLLAEEAGSAPGPVRQALVREALRRLDPGRYVGPPPLLLVEVAALLDASVPHGTRRGGRSGTLVERTARGLLFQRLPLPAPPPAATVGTLPARVAWPFPPQDLIAGRSAVGAGIGLGGRLATLDAAAAPLPLTVTAPRRGDRFHPLGGVRQRLSSFFAARGLPRVDRAYWPVVRDAAGEIVWVAGVEIAHGARITAATSEVLRLESRAREA
jgi:tRNA(Ile)-lysidine synthase